MADGFGSNGIIIDRVEVGASEPPEFRFAMSSWLRSYAEAYERKVIHRRMSESDRAAYFRREHPAVMAALRERTLLVARLQADPDTFVGWACGSPGEMLYVFVKRGPWRRCGLAARLVEQVAGKRGVYRYGSLHDKAVDAFERRGWRFDGAAPAP
jgi:hypothetical protein